ncbi:MAG: PDDEXK nuclease domain-containing protein [bacterium]|nr:PDDEXK nuclease domain-containing protein [bacterium]
MKTLKNKNPLSSLIKQIRSLVEGARVNVTRNINKEILQTYWQVGKHIVEFEQKGNIKAEYGKQLLLNLSKELVLELGKGFSRSNLTYMRLFYQRYQKGETVSHKLSWSHYFELLKIDDELERSFYQRQAITENWTTRELKRHKTSALFQRLALSKDKQGILALAKKGHIIKNDTDLVKDPYVLEFLNIPEKYKYSEKELEQNIIDNLQEFLLELGKGFAFIGRQYRVTLNNKHYRIDLVFYHRILKCFVLIDLKINDIEHHDIGQMNMYLGYFETELNEKNDNPPIGIILSAEKDSVMVEYAMHGISNKIFVSKYQLYLPDKKTLQRKVQEILDK